MRQHDRSSRSSSRRRQKFDPKLLLDQKPLEETHLEWSVIGDKTPPGVFGLVVPLGFLLFSPLLLMTVMLVYDLT